jgi:hypothetical protein
MQMKHQVRADERQRRAAPLRMRISPERYQPQIPPRKRTSYIHNYTIHLLTNNHKAKGEKIAELK